MNELESLLGLLAAEGPASEDRDRLMQFGQFVGSWKLDVSYFSADGSEGVALELGSRRQGNSRYIGVASKAKRTSD